MAFENRFAPFDALEGLLESNKHSDFTLEVDATKRKYHVHKSIVCWQSNVLAAAADGEFKFGAPNQCNSVWQETDENFTGSCQ